LFGASSVATRLRSCRHRWATACLVSQVIRAFPVTPAFPVTLHIPGTPHIPLCSGYENTSFTGKIDGVVYNHFGDFEAFILETFAGERHRFECHEVHVQKLVQRAGLLRILTTVMLRQDHLVRPSEIILHGAPPHQE
jgi:hypothetical protein